MSNATTERLRELAEMLAGMRDLPSKFVITDPSAIAEFDEAAAALRAHADILDRAANEPCAECQRMREGLQLIATDKHRLMNITARQTAASILAGKPSGVTTPPPEGVLPISIVTLERIRDWMLSSELDSDEDPSFEWAVARREVFEALAAHRAAATKGAE